MIDYRLLLLKYMDHVGYMEGITFIGPNYTSNIFTPEEWREMLLLNEESNSLPTNEHLK